MIARITDMHDKEVINVCDGTRLGFVDDVEVDSVGGWLYAQLGTEPRIGQMAAYRGHIFYVEEVDGVRITRVLIHRAGDLAEEHDEIVGIDGAF